MSVPGCLRIGTRAIVYGSSLIRTRHRADHIHRDKPARSGGVAELLSISLQVAACRRHRHIGTAALDALSKDGRRCENSGLGIVSFSVVLPVVGAWTGAALGSRPVFKMALLGALFGAIEAAVLWDGRMAPPGAEPKNATKLEDRMTPHS